MYFDALVLLWVGSDFLWSYVVAFDWVCHISDHVWNIADLLYSQIFSTSSQNNIVIHMLVYQKGTLQKKPNTRA